MSMSPHLVKPILILALAARFAVGMAAVPHDGPPDGPGLAATTAALLRFAPAGRVLPLAPHRAFGAGRSGARKIVAKSLAG